MDAGHGVETLWPRAGFQLNGGGYAPPLRQVIDLAVGLVFAVDIRDLNAKKRGSPKVAFARQVSMYLAHVACGLSLTDVGILYGRERSTVAHACCLVEDRRDDPELDSRLDHLERAIVALANALTRCWAPR